ncbi:hypothetical protein M8C21_006368 [Ambrosia artemisiifolia]|uniref:Uncharacterized protein n=1 Tax=Ambrosia artemisiifolia TaxID=4212 RepID=A0AAD5G4G4_AMBAR|nr:hypothetical protein M8C21_006368 [Ambrosia artemisiifolia]
MLFLLTNYFFYTVDTTRHKSHNAAECRKYRKLQLDAKRQKVHTNNVVDTRSTFNTPFNASSSVTLPELKRHKSAERRKFRKSHIDAKRRKVNSITGLTNQSIVTHDVPNKYTFATPINLSTSGQATNCIQSHLHHLLFKHKS